MHSTIRPVFKRRWIPVALALAISVMCTLYAFNAKATVSAPGCDPHASVKHSRFKRAVPKCAAQVSRHSSDGEVTSAAAGLRSGERMAAAASLARGPGRNQ